MTNGQTMHTLPGSSQFPTTRWTLVLLEDQVVERGIVARASDNTIGRTLKKTLSNRT